MNILISELMQHIIRKVQYLVLCLVSFIHQSSIKQHICTTNLHGEHSRTGKPRASLPHLASFYLEIFGKGEKKRGRGAG